MKKRILAILLTMVMIVTMLPAMTLALSASTWEVIEHPNSFTMNVGVRFQEEINMIFVEGGTFTLGWEEGTPGEAPEDTDPVPGVTVSDFWMSDSLVTVGLWNAVMGLNPPPDATRNNAFTGGHWYDFHEFLARMYILTGKMFYMPTEAQFEFAAKGGNPGYALGHNLMPFPSTFVQAEAVGPPGAVRQANPNILGFYDLSGREEWVWNAWNTSHIGGDDPVGIFSPIHAQRTRRGGVGTTGRPEFHTRLIRSVDGGGHAFRMVLSADQSSVPTGMTLPRNIHAPTVNDLDTPNSFRDPRWVTPPGYVWEGHYQGYAGGAMKVWETGEVVLRPHNFNGYDPGDIIGQWYTFNNYAMVIIPNEDSPNPERRRILIPYVFVGTEGQQVVSTINDRRNANTAGPYTVWPDVYMAPTGRLVMTRESDLIDFIATHRPHSPAAPVHFGQTYEDYLWYGGIFEPIQRPVVPGLRATALLAPGDGIVDPGHYLVEFGPNGRTVDVIPENARGNDPRLVDGPTRGWWMGYGFGGIHTYRKDIDLPGWHRHSIYTASPGQDVIANPGLARGPWFTVNNVFMRTQNNEAGTNFYDILYLIIPNAEGNVTTDCVHFTMRHISFMNYERGDSRIYHLRYNEDIERHTQEMPFRDGPFGFTMGNTTWRFSPAARRACPGIPTGPGLDDFITCGENVMNCTCPVLCRSCDSHECELTFVAFNNGTCEQVPSMAGNIRIWPQHSGVGGPVPMSAEITAIDQNGNDASQFVTRNRQWIEGQGWQNFYVNFDVDKNAPWQNITFTVTTSGRTAEVLLINNLFTKAEIIVTFDAMHSPDGEALGGFWRTAPGAGTAAEPNFRILQRLTTGVGGTLDVLPANPLRSGYNFEAWVLADGTAVTPTTEFTADTTVYTSWTRTWDDTFDVLRFNPSTAFVGTGQSGDLYVRNYRVQYVANPLVHGELNAAANNASTDGTLAVHAGGVHGMNIRVPVSLNGVAFTDEQLRNAPILVLNPWGGDSGAAVAAATGAGPAGLGLQALERGWIVVQHGMRGHTVGEAGVADTENFHNFGKLPHPIVDSKAVLRYLHWNINEGHLPWGDSERIFAQGHSSGGSAVSVLGASGNTPIYEVEMAMIGALPLSMSGVYDHLFAAIPVNPVQIRNWGDPAHAWELYQDSMHLTGSANIHPLNAILAQEWVRILQTSLSELVGIEISALAGVPLTPANYTEYLLEFMKDSVIRELNHISEHGLGGRPAVTPAIGNDPEILALRGRAAITEYLNRNKPADGTYSTPAMPMGFINPVFYGDTALVVDVNNTWADFMQHIWGDGRGTGAAGINQIDPTNLLQMRFDRPKTAQTIQERGIVQNAHTQNAYGDDLAIPPGQRPANLNRPVNTASARSFGTPNDFIAVYSDIGWQWIYAQHNIEISDDMRALLTFQRNSVDPMHFILDAQNNGVTIAPNWHIRNGTRDISPGRATILAHVTALENMGHNVNFEFTWNIGHSAAALTNDLPEFFEWADNALNAAKTCPPAGELTLEAFNNGTCEQVPGLAGTIRIWSRLDGVGTFVPMSAQITAIDQDGNDASQFVTRNRQWVDGAGWQDYYANFDVNKNAPWQYIYFTVNAFCQSVQILLINNLYVSTRIQAPVVREYFRIISGQNPNPHLAWDPIDGAVDYMVYAFDVNPFENPGATPVAVRSASAPVAPDQLHRGGMANAVPIPGIRPAIPVNFEFDMARPAINLMANFFTGDRYVTHLYYDPAPTLPPGDYWFRVRAIAADGATLGDSALSRNHRTAVATPPPAPGQPWTGEYVDGAGSYHSLFLDATTALEIMGNGVAGEDFMILDLRGFGYVQGVGPTTNHEFAQQGRLSGALVGYRFDVMNPSSFPAELMAFDRDKPVFVICLGGLRSRNGALILSGNSDLAAWFTGKNQAQFDVFNTNPFTNIIDLGGINQWPYGRDLSALVPGGPMHSGWSPAVPTPPIELDDNVITWGALPDSVTTYTLYIFTNASETDTANAVEIVTGLVAEGGGFRIPTGVSPQPTADSASFDLETLGLAAGAYYARLRAVVAPYLNGTPTWGQSSLLSAAIPFSIGDLTGPVFSLIDFNNGHDGNASLANMGVIRIWTRLDGVNALVPYGNLTVTAELPNGECAMQFVRINRIWNNPGYVNLIDVTKRDANWRYIDLTVTLGAQTVELLLINNLVTP